MRSKVVIASALLVTAFLVIGVSWSWIAENEPKTSETEEATEVGGPATGPRNEQRVDSKREQTAGKPSPTNPSAGPTARATAAAERGVARPGSPGGTGAAPLRRELAEAHDGERARAPDDSERELEIEPADDEFGRFKQQLEALRESAQETPGDDPIEPEEAEEAGLNSQDIDRLDLDADGAIAPWELERAKHLVDRAARFPEDYDLEDGAYPMEREDYARPAEEFDVIDTNRDGRMDEEEYYSFLHDTLRESILLDTDGDGLVSFEESGLSDDEFMPLDRDDNGSLKLWQIRQAIARGVWPKNLESR